MVLQRAPARAVVWGWGTSANEKITVTVGTIVQTGATIADNSFSISLPPFSAGGPYNVVVSSSTGQNITLTNVLFGDVYICSGQSNMQMTVSMSLNATQEIADASKYSQIRLFSVGVSSTSSTPQTQLITIQLGWVVSTPSVVGFGEWSYFSAVCWFFGRDLAIHTPGLPIGLISDKWGGTPVQAWSSPDALNKCPGSVYNKNNNYGTKNNYYGTKNSYYGTKNNYYGIKNVDPDPYTPTVLWNAMVVPFLQMQIKGVLWYQGEANSGDPVGYTCQFPAMIADWRAKFGQNFPFFFVQLSPWDQSGDGYSIAYTRTAQLAALNLPQVGFATAADLGDYSSPYGSIHPQNKQEVASRLFSAARVIAYGETNVVYQGPLFASAKIVSQPPNAQVAVSFTPGSIASGLTLLPVPACPVPASQCGWLSLQLSDSVWYNATASIQADTLLVTLPNARSGTSIKGVRYAFNSWPVCYLYNIVQNAVGLPAIPFQELF